MWGEIWPVSAPTPCPGRFPLIVQWCGSLPAHHSLASAYASRREGSQSWLRVRACVRFARATANRRLHDLGARPQTSALNFPHARVDTGRCCARSLQYACSTCVVSLRKAEAVHILGRLSTGGNAGWCSASSPDISRSQLSIRHNAARGCASLPKYVYGYMSRAACCIDWEEVTLVSLRQLALVYVRIHGWLSTRANVGRWWASLP